MTPSIVLLIMVILTVVMLILLVIIKFNSIMSFFYPHKYVEIIMLESDNNIRSWLQKKSSDLRLEFNGAYYNMVNAVYRKGRLAQFFFVEGNENPIDFRTVRATGDAERTRLSKRLDLANLFIQSIDFVDMLKRNWWLIVIGVIGVIVMINLQKGG